ncbi:ABC transporter ATP-binding protein [Amycolatopsis sp. FDAARGOS 1241]|uniref:ABC transporter ATP-binding protein n=1 Tax=Amycolatopsis sp. FDAARGOS 1241 TaxID=2778070 RepID=UPI00351C69D0
MLRAVGLSRAYGQGAGLVRAVDGIDLDVPAGQTLAVTGPSGCGKSTLLQLFGGLDRPSGGEVWLGGRRIDRLGERALARLRRRAVGFVFQAFHLMDELTAAENVELPALLSGASPRTARACAAGLLERVGLAGRARHLPSELSGGHGSASRSRGRWSTNRWWSSRTNPRGTSTAPRPATSSASSPSCARPVRRWCWSRTTNASPPPRTASCRCGTERWSTTPASAGWATPRRSARW